MGGDGRRAQEAVGVGPLASRTIGFDLATGLPNGFGFLLLGFYNGSPPFPLELSAFGMPNCFQFTDATALQFVVLDAAGASSVPLAIPNAGGLIAVRLFSQYACVDLPANAGGITTTNYNRVMIGN